MDIRLLIRKLEQRKGLAVRALSIIVAFGVVGLILVQTSSAATFVAASETENGTIAGNATTIGDSNASNANAVRFSQGGTAVTQTCPAYPAFPDANCTGVPAGTTLTNVSGDVTITSAGTIYDARNVQGKIYVQANNVTIKRTFAKNGIRLFDGYSNLLVEDVEMGGSGSSFGDDGIAFDGYTCRRCDIHGFSDGGKVNGGNTVIEDSYIHDNYQVAGDHNDGLQNVGGSGNVTIRHSNIDVRPSNVSDKGNAAIFFADNPSNALVSIENSLLAGGGYTLQLRDVGGYTAVVRGNRFVRNSYNFGTHIIADGDASRVTWDNNAFSDNGQVIDK